jgi:hypothetical protein
MQHVVQFFDLLETRAGSVARFVHEGVSSGKTAVIVARAGNVVAIDVALRRRGVSLATLVASGSVVVRDARSTLDELMGPHLPDVAKFGTVVGGLVRQLADAAPGGLAVYGEMVDLLAAEGNVEAALTLERLWNDLAERVPFTLMCGYAAAHFAGTSAGHRHLRTVCELHSEVRQDQADLLANWLLSAAEAAV